MACLSRQGITPSRIKDALRWFCTLPTIRLAGAPSMNAIQQLVEALVAGKHGRVRVQFDQIPHSCRTVIVVDHLNSEAVAAGHLLAVMLLRHFVQEPSQIPYVLPSRQPLPEGTEKVVIVCTPGALHCKTFLQTIVKAGQMQTHYVPVIADPFSHKALMSTQSPVNVLCRRPSMISNF